jgi:hypothetical protein
MIAPAMCSQFAKKVSSGCWPDHPTTQEFSNRRCRSAIFTPCGLAFARLRKLRKRASVSSRQSECGALLSVSCQDSSASSLSSRRSRMRERVKRVSVEVAESSNARSAACNAIDRSPTSLPPFACWSAATAKSRRRDSSRHLSIAVSRLVAAVWSLIALSRASIAGPGASIRRCAMPARCRFKEVGSFSAIARIPAAAARSRNGADPVAIARGSKGRYGIRLSGASSVRVLGSAARSASNLRSAGALRSHAIVTIAASASVGRPRRDSPRRGVCALSTIASAYLLV